MLLRSSFPLNSLFRTQDPGRGEHACFLWLEKQTPAPRLPTDLLVHHSCPYLPGSWERQSALLDDLDRQRLLTQFPECPALMQAGRPEWGSLPLCVLLSPPGLALCRSEGIFFERTPVCPIPTSQEAALCPVGHFAAVSPA